MIQINIPAWLRVSLYVAGAVAAKVGDYLLAKGVFGKPEADLCSWAASAALVLAVAHTVSRTGGKTTVEPLDSPDSDKAITETLAARVAAQSTPAPAKKTAARKTTPAQKKA